MCFRDEDETLIEERREYLLNVARIDARISAFDVDATDIEERCEEEHSGHCHNDDANGDEEPESELRDDE